MTIPRTEKHVVQAGILAEGWPALMSTEMAARYLSLDKEALLRLASHFNTPVVKGVDRPIRCRRQDLDLLIKKLPSAPSSYSDDRHPRLITLENSQIEAISDAIAQRVEPYTTGFESKLVSIKEACAILGIGRTSIYRMIAESRLETRRIGRRTLILRSDIQAILDGPT